MTFIRRQLIVLALAVTACQLSGLAAMPVAVCHMTDSNDFDAMMATCDHGPNVECPMHKHHPSSSSSSHENRVCRGCDEGVDYVLTVLITFAGPLIDRYQPAAPHEVSTPLAPSTDHLADVTHRLDSPPPRS